MKGARSVDEYIANHQAESEQLTILREAALSAGLEEKVKWGIPAFTWKNKNIAGMAVFKNWVAIWFFQGALLKDEKKVLVNAQEGTTKALRQWRFKSAEEVIQNKDYIYDYLVEALNNQKEGKEIKAEKGKKLVIPPELETVLTDNPELKKSFESFTPGKRREFAEYIAEAKREDTKEKRLEKIIPMILQGKGLNDKYKK